MKNPTAIYLMIIDSFFQEKAMEFRKSCSRSFAHFVFYPSQKSEKDADSQNLCNHVHLLLHISNKVKNTNEKDDFPFSHMPSTNWGLETVIDIVRNYFNAHQPGPGIAFPKGFRVEQRNVWCPFSIFAAFVHLQKSHVVIQGSVFQKTFKKAWQNHPENQRYFPKRPPVLRSKTVWQFHCH